MGGHLTPSPSTHTCTEEVPRLRTEAPLFRAPRAAAVPGESGHGALPSQPGYTALKGNVTSHSACHLSCLSALFQEFFNSGRGSEVIRGTRCPSTRVRGRKAPRPREGTQVTQNAPKTGI